MYIFKTDLITDKQIYMVITYFMKTTKEDGQNKEEKYNNYKETRFTTAHKLLAINPNYHDYIEF